MDTTDMATAMEETTRFDDLPVSCVAHVLALTSPRDVCRCAAVSPSATRERFVPADYLAILLRSSSGRSPPPSSKKKAYLRLSDNAVQVGDGCDTAVWLARGSGAKCVALSARKLSLSWDDGEFSWRWTPHPLSRFPEVAQLVGCTGLDIYGRLPVSALTPATNYAAYLVFSVADVGHRGLSFPDQETTVVVGGRAASSRAVCLCLNEEEEPRKFRGVVDADGVRRPERRDDGWSEMEMGRLRVDETVAAEEGVVVSFEVLGWYPKHGLIVEAVKFRPL
ncbi:putative F-box protein PP2-B12 [Lolium rigidum]|uniref:putative F-box protein PP2-B12 n=1 Tax=Lolium rigidum TaxID=89674 RepID=UPI001F5DE1B8|nr:putative F-box protein PP2-B12 [Lolium rigidum]